MRKLSPTPHLHSSTRYQPPPNPQNPYRPNGNIFYKAMNMAKRLFYVRNAENEFVDFRTQYFDEQIKTIYSDLHFAYRKKNKVILDRSTSESMNKVTFLRLTSPALTVLNL